MEAMEFLQCDVIDDTDVRDHVTKMYEDALSSMSEDDKAHFTAMIHWYQTAPLKDGVVAVGDTLPNLAIKTSNEALVNLYDILEKGPAIFVFFRSDWCDYCNYYIELIRKAMPVYRVAGAQLFAVTPETEFSRSDWYRFNSEGFEVISDANMEITDAFNINFTVPDFIVELMQAKGLEPYKTEKEWRLPLTGVFIVDPDRKVAWRHLAQDFRYRATPMQILDALDSTRAVS